MNILQFIYEQFVSINSNKSETNMIFYIQSYSESVPQDLPSGREVMRISATDIDDGNNSIVHYSLDSNSPDQAYFYIDPDNGVIFLNKTIDVSASSQTFTPKVLNN